MGRILYCDTVISALHPLFCTLVARLQTKTRTRAFSSPLQRAEKNVIFCQYELQNNRVQPMDGLCFSHVALLPRLTSFMGAFYDQQVTEALEVIYTGLRERGFSL